MAAERDNVPPSQQQQVEAGRDAANAGRDVNYTYNYYGTGVRESGRDPGAEQPSSGGATRENQQPSGRKIWGSIPARNRGFAGRAQLLATVRGALVAGDRVAVQALHGMGGVGKTQLAIEYAHSFAGDYNLVWWINSERPELIAEQFAALGMELGCVPDGAPVAQVQRAVLMALHDRDRWLLIFDNVEQPSHVAPWLPGGAGHIIITSRAYGWDELAVPVPVDVFSRDESVAILRTRVPGLSEPEADAVAAAVGDLPLAIAQAAGYIAYTRIPPAEYVNLLLDQPAEVLELGKPWHYPRSLTAATRLSFEHLQAHDPVAADVVSICAFLAPEPIPTEWFPKAADGLTGPLRTQARDRVTWRQIIYRLRDSALVRVDPDGIVMHRLTQAIIRGRPAEEDAASMASVAVATVAANAPGDPAVPETWPSWARTIPHVFALNPANSDIVELRTMAAQAVLYLLQRGDSDEARAMASYLLAEWGDRVDGDDRPALLVGNSLAGALSRMGRKAEARDIAEDILARYRRNFGDDDPGTLIAASNLANYLRDVGEHAKARQLDEETLGRLRGTLGEDHPETLRSASNLGEDLCKLGDYSAAREMEEDTLARSRRVLGPDHLETLRSARNLGDDYRGLGEYAAALRLDEDTLERSRRVLGEDHLYALWAASNLATDLRELGEYEAARILDEDTLARRQRVLGAGHPKTRESARNLAEDRRLLGENG